MMEPSVLDDDSLSTDDAIPYWFYEEDSSDGQYSNSQSVTMSADQIPFTDPRIVTRVYQLARAIHDTFTTCELHYWTSGGTTLGCIRHQGLIPWDDDIDLCIYKEDVESKLLCSVKTLLNSNGYKIVEAPSVGYRIFHETDSDELASCTSHRYPFCDVFVMKCLNIDQNKKCVIADACGRTIWPEEVYLVEDTQNIIQKSFGDFVLNCPRNAEAYLDHMYSNSWRIEGCTTSYDHVTRNYITSFRFPLTEELYRQANSLSQ